MEAPKPPSVSSSQYFQVFLRLRPSSPQSSISDSRFLTAAPSCVYVTPPNTSTHSKSRPVEKFTFARVFDESANQLDLFHETVLPLVQDAVLGRDAMLATLGVSGTGKTHTILGNREQKGMTQMALDVLFNSLTPDRMADPMTVDIPGSDHSDATILSASQFHSRMTAALEGHGSKRASIVQTPPKNPDTSSISIPSDPKSKYAILISMYELYNDRIFDLLDETPLLNPSSRRKALVFKKPSNTSTWDSSRDTRKVVSGLRKIYVRTLSEALAVLEHGQLCRRASPTNANLVSSRSHAFFCVELKRFSARSGTERDSASLQIVDLAGSERARTAQTAGDRLVEAGSINRSLMCLGQCLQLQSQTGGSSSSTRTALVRGSKLTELLFSNSFSGATARSRAAMIVTADAKGDYNATSQILRYSALAKDIAVPRRQVSIASSVTTEGDDKDEIIARLISQLEETESQWKAAEERCLTIEQTVREEVAAEMEERLQAVLRRHAEDREEEEAAREGYVDGKLEILARGVEIYEDAEEEELEEPEERIAELEEENDRLRLEVMKLRREMNNKSPTHEKRGKKRSGGRPLTDVENEQALGEEFARLCL